MFCHEEDAMTARRPSLSLLICLLMVVGCTPTAIPVPPTSAPPSAAPPTTIPPTKPPPVIPEDPIEVANAWIAALNAGDMETALAHFTDREIAGRESLWPGLRGLGETR
jgi:hypothetical protein